MSNTLSKTEIINICLASAFNEITDSLAGQETAAKIKANLFYKEAYQNLMKKFPWNFATKRDIMVSRQLPTTDPTGFFYRHEIPASASLLWSIYINEYSDRAQSSYYAGGGSPPVSVPVNCWSSRLWGDSLEGEFLNGAVYSNYPVMYCYYTHNLEVPDSDLDANFVTILINKVTDKLLRGKQTDVDTLGIRTRIHAGENKEALAEASIENRKAKTQPLTRTKARIQQHIGW